jgi:hypothetical protein
LNTKTGATEISNQPCSWIQQVQHDKKQIEKPKGVKEEEHIPARIIGGEKETDTKGAFFLTLAMYNKQSGSQREGLWWLLIGHQHIRRFNETDSSKVVSPSSLLLDPIWQ